jgi:large subunit ribosomal protein L35
MKKNKQKTHSGALKRFKITGTKKLRRRSAFRSHLLGHKNQDQKRNFTKDLKVAKGDQKNVRKMLGM